MWPGRLLDEALAREDYDVAARLLLVAVLRALAKMPPDSLEGLLDTVAGRKNGRKARRRRIVKKDY